LAAAGLSTATAQPTFDEALSHTRHRKYGASSTIRYPNLEPR
jgi:hypothetical protein